MQQRLKHPSLHGAGSSTSLLLQGLSSSPPLACALLGLFIQLDAEAGLQFPWLWYVLMCADDVDTDMASRRS